MNASNKIVDPMDTSDQAQENKSLEDKLRDINILAGAEGRIHAALEEEKHKELVTQLQTYFSNLNMPHNVYSKLPKKIQKVYRERALGVPGHTRGRPLRMDEKRAISNQNKRSVRRYKTAKLSRKINRAK